MILGAMPGACVAAEKYPGYEVWSVKALHGACKHPVTRIFEIHPIDWSGRQSEILAMLKGKGGEIAVPVFMREHVEAIPSSLAYPIKDVMRLVKQRYFTCTVSYMLGLLLFEHVMFPGAPVSKVVMVGTFGTPETAYWRTDGTYWQQRASVEYLLGLAEGWGIDVEIGEGLELFRGRNYAGLVPDESVGYIGNNPEALEEVTNFGNSTK